MMIRKLQDKFISGVVDLGVIFVITYLILQLPQDNESVILSIGLGTVALFYFILFVEEVFSDVFGD